MSLTVRIGAAGLAIALATGLVAPAATAGSHDRRALRPMLATSTKHVVVGQRLVLKGAVAPAVKGTRVILQKRVGEKRWVEEARLRTNHNGGFTYRDKPHVAGERSYRAIVPGGGRSKPVSVTVYRWQSLTKVPVRSSVSTGKGREGSIGGDLFAPVIEGDWGPMAQQGQIDWNLGRKCLELRTTVGNGDNADATAVANISLSGDTKTLYAKSFGLTDSARVSLDLTGVFRLTFGWTATNPTPGGADAMLAEPEVLCAF